MTPKFVFASSALLAQALGFAIFNVPQYSLPTADQSPANVVIDLGMFSSSGRIFSYQSAYGKNITMVTDFFTATDLKSGLGRSEYKLVHSTSVPSYNMSLESVLQSTFAQQQYSEIENFSEASASTTIVTESNTYLLAGYFGGEIDCHKRSYSPRPLKIVGDFEKFAFAGHRLAKVYKVGNDVVSLFGAQSNHVHGMSSSEQYIVVDAFDGHLLAFVAYYAGDEGQIGFISMVFNDYQPISKSDLDKYIKVPADVEALCTEINK